MTSSVNPFALGDVDLAEELVEVLGGRDRRRDVRQEDPEAHRQRVTTTTDELCPAPMT